MLLSMSFAEQLPDVPPAAAAAQDLPHEISRRQAGASLDEARQHEHEP